MNIMVGTTTILIILIWDMVVMVDMVATVAGDSTWVTDMADGDLECPLAILPMVGVDTVTVVIMVDTMIPGVHGDMADTTADLIGVVITMVIIMVTMTDIMAAEDITILHHIHMEKWIAAVLTGIHDHQGIVQVAATLQVYMTLRRLCQEQLPRILQAAVQGLVFHLTRPQQKQLVRLQQ